VIRYNTAREPKWKGRFAGGQAPPETEEETVQVMELEQVTGNIPKGVHELLEKRFSPYAFSSRPVEAEKLHKLFEAARSAPSSYNEQPWRFVVARREDAGAFERLLETLMERNREWAHHAPALVLSVAKLDFTHNGLPNRHAWYDVGQAAAYLTLQATELGLYVHPMAGFDAGKASQLLNIPEGYQPVAMMAVGYLGDSESMPERRGRHEKPPRARKPLDSLLFEGTWGVPWSPAGNVKTTRSVQ
jgi:nitroreductase